MFIRRRDVPKYIETLENIIEAMSTDFAHVFQMVAISLNEEDLVDIYAQQSEGPTTLENILIKEGKLSKVDCGRNPLTEMLYSRLAKYIDGTDPVSSENIGECCPKCGSLNIFEDSLDTSPPLITKRCLQCGWTFHDRIGG